MSTTQYTIQSKKILQPFLDRWSSTLSYKRAYTPFHKQQQDVLEKQPQKQTFKYSQEQLKPITKETQHNTKTRSFGTQYELLDIKDNLINSEKQLENNQELSSPPAHSISQWLATPYEKTSYSNVSTPPPLSTKIPSPIISGANNKENNQLTELTHNKRKASSSLFLNITPKQQRQTKISSLCTPQLKQQTLIYLPSNTIVTSTPLDPDLEELIKENLNNLDDDFFKN